MTRKGQAKFYKKYLGFIIALPICAVLLFVIISNIPEKQYFFDNYTCDQLLYLNITKGGKAIPQDMLDKLDKLLEENECTQWTTTR